MRLARLTAVLLLLSAPARAEVASITLPRQYGIAFIPFLVM